MSDTLHSSTRRHVTATIAARATAASASAASALLVTRALDKAQYGKYGIAVGVAGMLVILSDLGLTTSTARSIAAGTATLRVLARVAVVRMTAAFVAAGLMVAWGLYASATSSTAMTPSYPIAAAGFLLAATVTGVASGLLPALRQIKVLTFITILQPILELAGVLIAISLSLGGRGIILSAAGAAALAGIIGVVAVIRGIRHAELQHDPPEDAEVAARTRELFAYGRAMFIVGASFAVFGQIDQLFLWAFHGSEEAAPYIACWRLATLLHLPGFAAATIIAPRLARAGAEERSEFTKWASLLFVTYLGGITIAVILSPDLVPTILGGDYVDAGSVFAALGIYAVLLGVAPLITMAANYLGGARSRVRLGLTSIGLNLALDIVLIPGLGVYGAAIATTVAFTYYVHGHIRLTWGLLGNDGSFARRVPLARLLICVAAAVLSGTAAHFALPHIADAIPYAAAVLGTSALAFGLYMIVAVAAWRPRASTG